MNQYLDGSEMSAAASRRADKARFAPCGCRAGAHKRDCELFVPVRTTPQLDQEAKIALAADRSRINDRLLKALRQLVADWGAVDPKVQVPDEINTDAHWEEARAAIAQAEEKETE